MLECKEILGMQIMLGEVPTQTSLTLRQVLEAEKHASKHIPLI